MDDYLSEKEQLEQFRAWWAEYGWYVIGGVVLGVVLLYGWNQYQSSRIEAGIAASERYDALVEYLADNEVEKAEMLADELALEHGDTVYAAQAKLALARLYMDRNRDEDAAEVLRQLLETDGHENLKHVGRLRLARILLYQEKPEEVVAMLASPESSAFSARYSEVLGDAYVELSRYADARSAYEAALNETVATVDTQLVQLKLLDLPDDIEPADALEDESAAEAADPLGLESAAEDARDAERDE